MRMTAPRAGALASSRSHSVRAANRRARTSTPRRRCRARPPPAAPIRLRNLSPHSRRRGGGRQRRAAARSASAGALYLAGVLPNSPANMARFIRAPQVDQTADDDAGPAGARSRTRPTWSATFIACAEGTRSMRTLLVLAVDCARRARRPARCSSIPASTTSRRPSSTTAPVYWLLETGMRQSVRHHARAIAVPPLADPALVVRGRALHDEHCVRCHGAPGVAPDVVRIGPHAAARQSRAYCARMAAGGAVLGRQERHQDGGHARLGVPAWRRRSVGDRRLSRSVCPASRRRSIASTRAGRRHGGIAAGGAARRARSRTRQDRHSTVRVRNLSRDPGHRRRPGHRGSAADRYRAARLHRGHRSEQRATT